MHFTNAIKNIGNNFMYKCSSFNKELHLDYLVDLSQIGDNFLYECVEFNHEINIKSKHLKIIGDSFLHGCKKFNSNFYLNSPVLKGIGDSFFECCTSYNKPIDFSNLIGLKSLKKKYFAHCENFNSDMLLPPNLMEIDDDFMINNCEYNHPLIFPNSIKTIGKSCCENLIKYNQNINIPESIIARDSINDTSDKYGIGDYFFRNCWSMTSTINFGLHDIAKIFIGSHSLSC
ncbi:leucine-rich repeat protein, partial [bacterium]|nr:leucine-rich repeat protein [bacterium]